MPDLKHPKIIWFKGGLFAALGCLASALLLAQQPNLRSVVLLAITVWAFCRAYYFAFYVIQHYVDPQYRFSGLIDFCQYAISTTRRPSRPDDSN